MSDTYLVNVNKVAKNVLSIGQFGLFQIHELNLIVTHWFMLSVTEDQFWKIQCKLEAKQKNVWQYKGKDGMQICKGASEDEIYALYHSIVCEQSKPINRTHLTYGNIELFTDNSNYIGVPVKYLEMIDYPPTVKRTPGRESVIVDEVHVFTVVSKEHTESKFLKQLSI